MPDLILFDRRFFEKIANGEFTLEAVSLSRTTICVAVHVGGVWVKTTVARESVELEQKRLPAQLCCDVRRLFALIDPEAEIQKSPLERIVMRQAASALIKCFGPFPYPCPGSLAPLEKVAYQHRKARRWWWRFIRVVRPKSPVIIGSARLRPGL